MIKYSKYKNLIRKNKELQIKFSLDRIEPRLLERYFVSFKIINSLNQIPSNTSIFIYGAGLAGQYFLKLLNYHRKDINIIAFIDDNIKKNIGEFKVIELNMIKDIDSTNLIIIASRYVNNIKKKIEEYDKILYLKTFFLNPFFYSGHLISEDEWISKNQYCDLEIFNIDESYICDFKSNIDKVKNILQTKEDKALYQLLSEERIEFSGNLIKKLKSFNFIYKPYFDFINTDFIKSIVEGGVFDGYTTLQFLTIPNNIKIYGFEPNIQEYKNSLFYNELSQFKNITIFKEALWSSEEILNFEIYENDKAPASQVLKNGQGSKIKGISLDKNKKLIPKIDFIKLDTEGSEQEILLGVQNRLINERPQMAISIYHSHEDFIEIPLLLSSWLNNYIFHLGHYSTNLNETILYAIPEEIYYANEGK